MFLCFLNLLHNKLLNFTSNLFPNFLTFFKDDLRFFLLYLLIIYKIKFSLMICVFEILSVEHYFLQRQRRVKINANRSR